MTSEPLQTVLVTGSSRGIGAAVVDALAATGRFRIYGLSRGMPESTTGDLLGGRSVRCDLADAQSLARALDEILDDAGGVDVAVLNAGKGVFRPVEALRPEEWEDLLALNLTSPYLVLNRVLPGMKQRNYGRIAVVSSDAQTISYPGASAYCASKAGLSMLAQCVRKEVRGTDIHVSTIVPGRVDTHFNNKRPGDRPEALRAEHVAAQVLHAISQPAGCEIEEIALNSTAEKELH